MQNDKNFNIGKNQMLYTKYSRENGPITHILCRQFNCEPNKMWILLDVKEDGTLKKVAQGANPLMLENHIDYIKQKKEN